MEKGWKIAQFFGYTFEPLEGDVDQVIFAGVVFIRGVLEVSSQDG
jgi:hypothetical protein